jgi:hypothetical protein
MLIKIKIIFKSCIKYPCSELDAVAYDTWEVEIGRIGA